MVYRFLLDTHTLVFWSLKRDISQEFISLLNSKAELGLVYLSAVSFWEVALLFKKGKIEIEQGLWNWQKEVMSQSHSHLIEPSAEEMMESVFLPDHHRDPFDRLLITQAQTHQLQLVSKDRALQHYDVEVFWMT